MSGSAVWVLLPLLLALLACGCCPREVLLEVLLLGVVDSSLRDLPLALLLDTCKK
jgi:hypothetical protein